MTTHTLFVKASNPRQMRQIGDMLRLPFEDLDANVKVVGTIADRWVEIDVSGEDEAIATNYLAKEFNFCPTTFENLPKDGDVKGYVVDLGKKAEEIDVDIGVFQPTIVNAHVSLRHLQDQLVGGDKLALKKIVELFGFCDDLPVNVEITTINEAESRIEAELSATQVEQVVSWQESLLDRLIVIGASQHEIRKTLNLMGLSRDVIAVEPLGTFEHVLTCKLGTDAAGLIRNLGRNLKHATFTVFNPRKIRQFRGPPFFKIAE
jgi:hypothetical protein